MRSTITRLVAIFILSVVAQAQKPRERDLKLPIGGTPGALDAITDVQGVEVGHTTLISGSGKLVVGKGPVRTGVTVIHPRGKANSDPVFAAWFTLNGNGEMTGTTWVQESGLLEGPVAVTNTHSVGVVRDAIIQWEVSQKNALQPWWLPVVAETYDGGLNDINGFHVRPEHVFAALEGARPGRVAEGNVGGGTGMRCYGFKCGTGTSSRKIDVRFGGHTVGVLVQANHGTRDLLRIAGVPVGQELPQPPPAARGAGMEIGPVGPVGPIGPIGPTGNDALGEMGSIIIVVATDAPLLPHQLKRVARRASLGLARTGSVSSNGSGDIFIAFSTANPGAGGAREVAQVAMMSNDRIGAVFEATVQATEEAIVNALVAAETMRGAEGRQLEAISHEALRQVLRKYNRLAR